MINVYRSPVRQWSFFQCLDCGHSEDIPDRRIEDRIEAHLAVCSAVSRRQSLGLKPGAPKFSDDLPARQ